VSDFVLDASLALQWFLDDEADRKYSLSVLATLSEKRAAVPILWLYEVGNGLLMAHRRKRISLQQVEEFLSRLRALPIDVAEQNIADIFGLPAFAAAHGLTNYDAAYLAVCLQKDLPLATTDGKLRQVAGLTGVRLVV